VAKKSRPYFVVLHCMLSCSSSAVLCVATENRSQISILQLLILKNQQKSIAK